MARNYKASDKSTYISNLLHFRVCDDAPRLDPFESLRIKPAYSARKRQRDRSSSSSDSDGYVMHLCSLLDLP